MPFVYDSAGNIVTQDVNGQKLPVFKHADGKEAPFDADSAISTIAARNAEAKQHREAKEAAEAALKPFKDAGISDAAAAAKALNIAKNLDEKNLIAAGDRDKAVAEAVRAVEEKYKPVAERATTLEQQLNAHLIGGAFATSQFVATKVNAADAASAAQIARGLFGSNLKVEDGKVVGYDSNGNRIYSLKRPGELADAHEAIEVLITSSPLAPSILKGANASGGGASGGSGGSGSKKTYTRQQFAGLDPRQQAAVAKDMREGKAELIDNP